MRSTGEDLARESLFDASLKLAATLDVSEILSEFVKTACRFSEASFGALCVVNPRGDTVAFVEENVPDWAREQLLDPQVQTSMLEGLPASHPLVENHPEPNRPFSLRNNSEHGIDNYIGLPLTVRNRIFGWLYVFNRSKGFSDNHSELLSALSSAAAVAVENARLYGEARTREHWIRASQDLTTMLLSGASEEEALAATAYSIRDVADAEAALIILPSVGDTWACEFVDGDSASHLLGTVFPSNGRAMTVARTGQGVVIDSLAQTLHLKVPALKSYGPALYVPMRSRGESTGVILVLRSRDAREFTHSDLAIAQSVAAHAALALELADAKHKAAVATLQAEREQIGRDLHDLAIQQLFATGMQLSSLKDAFVAATKQLEETDLLQVAGIDEKNLMHQLESALASIGDSAQQIRAIVSSLRKEKNLPYSDSSLLTRLQHEASLGRSSLGFAPTFIVELDKHVLDVLEEGYEANSDAIDELLPQSVAEHLIAVIRESLSNISKHAHATLVKVHLEIKADEKQVTLTVTDNGVGLPERPTRNSGLANMRSRALNVDGSFDAAAQAEGGTKLVWSAPL
ncbi:hypothetical protein BM477_03020 [Boudabousia marimammalium]|uniref:GAF domain-containing protein n=2 Tax=Boudabousia marimammalium TaxID=156892 RepID=A0A1Q5PRL6_9ACTO|nr:hypothetical protein BM477_03020 [Boudabousia marimammalium]